MKIKNLFTGIIVILLAVLTSCSEDLLDIPRKGVVPKTEFYQTDTHAEEALAMIYRNAWQWMYNSDHGAYPLLKNLLSDELYCGGLVRNDQQQWESLNEYTSSTGNTYPLNFFQNCYNVIYRCNLILDNFTGDNLDTPVKKRAVAEAKIWRAFVYMELITLWGTPPLVDHCLEPTEYKQGNGDPQELWNLVTTDLTDAINSGALYQKTTLTDKFANFTVGYAQALLGKAYIYMTYSLNGGAKGGPDAIAAPAKALTATEYWSKAAETLDKVINSGMYRLYQGDFTNIYKTDLNFDPENMWEWNRAPYNTASASMNLRPGWESYLHGWATGQIFAYGDIVPCVRSSNFFTPRKTAYDRMVAWNGGEDNNRMYGSIRTFEQIIKNMQIATIPGVTTIYACDGLFDMKWFRDENDDCKGGGHYTEKGYPTMRYAEVLLLAAEANLMMGNQGKADTYMNEVRKRAGLAEMSNITLSDLQQEKQCELYAEGTRGYDLVRWGLAAEILKDQGKDFPTFTAWTDGTSSPINFVESRWSGSITVDNTQYTLGVSRIPINESGYGFKAGKHELLPFPHQELLLSGEIVGGPLKQNPGW